MSSCIGLVDIVSFRPLVLYHRSLSCWWLQTNQSLMPLVVQVSWWNSLHEQSHFPDPSAPGRAKQTPTAMDLKMTVHVPTPSWALFGWCTRIRLFFFHEIPETSRNNGCLIVIISDYHNGLWSLWSFQGNIMDYQPKHWNIWNYTSLSWLKIQPLWFLKIPTYVNNLLQSRRK